MGGIFGMKSDTIQDTFRKRIGRGRKFEKWERSFWTDATNKEAEFEAATKWEGKRGRVDIRLSLKDTGQIVIVEIKATDWNRMQSHPGSHHGNGYQPLRLNGPGPGCGRTALVWRVPAGCPENGRSVG